MSVDKLVIDRALWGTGSLLNDDGRMCCLGHLSLACGVPKKEMGIRVSPRHAWIKEYGLPEWVFFGVYGTWNRVADINDNFTLSEQEREFKLIELFKRYNIDLSFIGSFIGKPHEY